MRDTTILKHSISVIDIRKRNWNIPCSIWVCNLAYGLDNSDLFCFTRLCSSSFPECFFILRKNFDTEYIRQVPNAHYSLFLFCFSR